MASRYISVQIKQEILENQKYKCANKPTVYLYNIEGYKCKLWQNKENPGLMAKGGYEIDHRIEFALTRDNDIMNLQALCPECHKVKTKNFMKYLLSKDISTIIPFEQYNEDNLKLKENNNMLGFYNNLINEPSTMDPEIICDPWGDEADFDDYPIINMITFGEDSIDDLSEQEIKYVVALRGDLIKNLTTMLNFRRNKPQHHNIFRSTANDSYCRVYREGAWDIVHTTNVADSVLTIRRSDFTKMLLMPYLNDDEKKFVRATLAALNSDDPRTKKAIVVGIKKCLSTRNGIVMMTKNLLPKLTKEQESEITTKYDTTHTECSHDEPNKPSKSCESDESYESDEQCGLDESDEDANYITISKLPPAKKYTKKPTKTVSRGKAPPKAPPKKSVQTPTKVVSNDKVSQKKKP